MIEITRQLSGLAKKVETLTDVIEVMQWVLDLDDLYCTASARTDGTVFMEVGGVEVQSVEVQLGQWVIFDGVRFSALTQEEFEAQGYSEPSE